MNAAIASASLLGFGDKPASQSMQSFAETLNKMYETQLKAFKGEETSRKSAIEEYNKQQRAKKKKESDIQELLKKMGGGEGEGKKTKKKKGGGLLTALLGGTALVGGAALLAPVIAPLVVGIASKALGDMLTKKVKEIVDPIVESITKPFDLFFKEQEGEEEVPAGMVRNADGRLVPSAMPQSRDMDIEETMVENADGRMVPREMPSSRDTDLEGDVEDKLPAPPAQAVSDAVSPSTSSDSDDETQSPAQAVSDAVSPSTSSDSGGGTAWDPVLEMISSAESRGRYDIMYGGKIIDGITEMTIAQAAKKAGDRGDGKNYAIGKYQFITLVEQAKAAGLNPNKDKFSPKNQDKIAIDLITRKRGVTKQMAKNNPKEAGKRLAMEWAGLPVLAPTKGAKRDVNRGQSYYAGDGVNKSTITPEQVEASFQKLQKGGEVKENKVVTKKKNEIISKYKGDERAKLGALENRKFKEKSPLFQETNPIKKQKGGLILFAGHTDVPIGHSQPGTDAPGTPLQNKYKPTAEQHFANKVGSQTASLAQNQDVSISFRPAKGRYASTSNPNSNWAQIKSIRSQGGSAIDLHFDAYGYEKGKLIQGARGFIGNGFNLTDIEKKVAEKFGNHPTGTTFPVPILELDPINKAPGSVNTYAQMIVNAVKGVSGSSQQEKSQSGSDNVTAQEETVKVSPVSQSVAGGSRGEKTQDLKDNKKSTSIQSQKSTSTTTEETNKTGVAAILQAAEENTGIGAGQSMQCANTTRQVLRAAGHPDANKTTKKGDLDAEGLKYSAPSFAASFAGTDMGQIKESTSALAPGDIVLWKNTFSSMGGDKPGAITHVGIKGKGADVYHHGSGPGWRKTGMFDGGKFAYGVTLSGSGSATGENLNTTSNNNTTGSGVDAIFNNFTSQLLGNTTGIDMSTLGGVSSGGGIDAIFSNFASKLLAPILGSIASIMGVPLTGSSETTGSTSTTSGGGGGGGDASNVAGISLGSTEYVKLMKETMDKGGITNKNERIMFMAQVGHESGDGQYMEEIADGSAYEGRSDLGNTQPGDGKRYKGRGYIQITGRANYAKYGPMIGVPDAVENPEKLAQPQNAAKVALAYWLDRVDRSAAQKGMDGMRTVTRNINGGLNGLSDRIAKFQKYSKMPEISASSSPVMAQKGGMIESNLKPTKSQKNIITNKFKPTKLQQSSMIESSSMPTKLQQSSMIESSSMPTKLQQGGNVHTNNLTNIKSQNNTITNNLKPIKLQQGGTVGGQINTGTLRGVQNTNITKLKEMSQKMKKRGPKVIRVQAPPTEAPKPIIASSGGGSSTPQGGMMMSELADYMHRVSMGALA